MSVACPESTYSSFSHLRVRAVLFTLLTCGVYLSDSEAEGYMCTCHVHVYSQVYTTLTGLWMRSYSQQSTSKNSSVVLEVGLFNDAI